MTYKRLTGLSLAIAAAMTFANPVWAAPVSADLRSESAANDAITFNEVMDRSLSEAFELIRNDVTLGEFSSDELIARIDALIARVDAKLAAGDGEQLELIKLRNASLRVRNEVLQFSQINGTRLVQLSTPPMPVGGQVIGDSNVGTPAPAGNIVSDTLLSERVVGQSVLQNTPAAGTIVSGPVAGGTVVSPRVISGGGGGGFGGGAIGGRGLLLGGIAAGIAIPIAVSDDDDDDNAGPIGSQSDD